MLFSIEIMKWEGDSFRPLPDSTYSGKTVRQVLTDISGQDIVIKVHQGMLGDYFVCGSEAASLPLASKNRKILSCEAALNLWDGTPIPDLTWPIMPPAL